MDEVARENCLKLRYRAVIDWLQSRVQNEAKTKQNAKERHGWLFSHCLASSNFTVALHRLSVSMWHCCLSKWLSHKTTASIPFYKWYCEILKLSYVFSCHPIDTLVAPPPFPLLKMRLGLSISAGTPQPLSRKNSLAKFRRLDVFFTAKSPHWAVI